mgnify:CR=1 FL=1
MKAQESKQLFSRKWNILNVVESLDIFGVPLPAFNFKGKRVIHTRLGGACTLLILAVTILFSCVKFVQLLDRHNPFLSQWYIDTYEERMNLNEQGFRFAVAIEDYYSTTTSLKHDKRYIQYLFRLYSKSQGAITVKNLDYRLCGEDDYSQFYPIHEQSKNKLEKIKSDPNRGFLCIDWRDEEPLWIFGEENDDEFQRLEVWVLPCNSQYTDTGPLPGEISEDCDPSLDAQSKYLANSQILLLVNQMNYNPENFGKDDKIKRESLLLNEQFRSDEPSWLDNKMQF